MPSNREWPLKPAVAVLLGLAALAASCLPPPVTRLPSPTPVGEPLASRSITVEGEGIAPGVRDKAELRLYVEAQGASSMEATESLNAAREATLARLSALGIDTREVVPQQINIHEASIPPPTPVPSPTPAQWRAFRFLSVSVAPIPGGPDLASELVAAGAPNVQNISFHEDKVEARFSVEAASGSPTGAQAEVSKKADSIREALVAKGFKVLEVNVTQAGLTPLPMRPEEVRIRTFVARQGLLASTKRLELIPRIMEAVAPVGKVEAVAFVIGNPEGLVDKAREAALADARRKAEDIASREALKLGSAQNVMELYSSGPPALSTPYAPQGLLTWIPPGLGQSILPASDARVRLRVTYSIK